MQVLQESPLNTQPHLQNLTKHFITPIDEIFARNHGDIPEIREDLYRLKLVITPSICEELNTLTGLDYQPITKELSLKDIKSLWNQTKIVAALEVNTVPTDVIQVSLTRRTSVRW